MATRSRKCDQVLAYASAPTGLISFALILWGRPSHGAARWRQPEAEEASKPALGAEGRRRWFYIGEVALKGEILPGEQPAIIDRDLFDAVQAKLNAQRTHHTVMRGQSEALLIGRIYDDRGNRMTPSHVRKGGIKYRYYLSSPLLHGQPGRSGSMRRVPAAALVESPVRKHLADCTEGDDRDLIRSHVVRVDLQVDQLAIELKAAKASGNPRNALDNDRLVLRIPWKKTPMRRRREIIVPASVSTSFDPCAPRPAPRWSHRSRVAGDGLRRSLPAPSPVSSRLLPGKNAAFGKSI